MQMFSIKKTGFRQAVTKYTCIYLPPKAPNKFSYAHPRNCPPLRSPNPSLPKKLYPKKRFHQNRRLITLPTELQRNPTIQLIRIRQLQRVPLRSPAPPQPATSVRITLRTSPLSSPRVKKTTTLSSPRAAASSPHLPHAPSASLCRRLRRHLLLRGMADEVRRDWPGLATPGRLLAPGGQRGALVEATPDPTGDDQVPPIPRRQRSLIRRGRRQILFQSLRCRLLAPSFSSLARSLF